MIAPVLAVSGVTRTYRMGEVEVQALRGVDLSLSAAEQQRAAIARAIAKRPDELLCDEPTGALKEGAARFNPATRNDLPL